MSTITPGTTINFTVNKAPTSAAAQKTLVRLLSKDGAIVKENARLLKTRKANERITQRGGRVRLWAGRVRKQRPVQGVVGESAQIVATLDILQDLASVERFVEVKQA